MFLGLFIFAMFLGLFIFDKLKMFIHCAQILCGETLRKFPLDHSLGKNLNSQSFESHD